MATKPTFSICIVRICVKHICESEDHSSPLSDIAKSVLDLVFDQRLHFMLQLEELVDVSGEIPDTIRFEITLDRIGKWSIPATRATG